MLIVAYGAALRLDAVIAKYGPADGPAWVEGLQHQFHRVEEPYAGGDPINYLRYAREMDGFYQPHVREPVFLATTRAFLWLTGQQDIAVSFASAFFSTLAVLATYVLGAYAFGPVVGLGAAAALAIERDAIGWGASGWRDDTFTFFVVLSFYVALRLHRHASVGNAVAAGVVWAGACLTRITSLSFILPIALYLVLQHARQPEARRVALRFVGGGLVVMALLVTPYLFNCWVEFGDPFYAIDDHTQFYRARQGIDDAEAPMSWSAYLWEQAVECPAGFVDSALVGLTLYPFNNKWVGFNVWSPALAAGLKWLAVFGLMGMAWSPRGRLMLLATLAAIVPYAFTWQIVGGAEWRFTLHAYPIFLIAAGLAVHRMGILVWSLTRPSGRHALREWRGAAWKVGATGLAALAFWATLAIFPFWRFTEELRKDGAAAALAGDRDWIFFRQGWSSVGRRENIVARFSRGPTATIYFPLRRAIDHSLLANLDTVWYEGAPPQQVLLRLNGALIGSIAPGWNPERVGAYTFQVPGSIVKSGWNRLDFEASYATALSSLTAEQIAPWAQTRPVPDADEETAIMLRYVRLEPAGRP